MKFHSLWLSGLLFGTVQVYAVQPSDFVNPKAIQQTCKEQSPMQQDLMNCSSKRYLQSDLALNKTYQSTIKKLSSRQQKKLLTSQRSWLKVRNEQCDAKYEQMKDGREAPIYYLGCYSQANEKRTRYLGTYR